MLMVQIINKLRRSRATGPIFGGRVAGAADASRVMDYANMDVPACFVCFLSDVAEPTPRGANEVHVRFTTSWGIIVKLTAHMDIRGQDPAMTVPDVRVALFRALLNWSPSVIPPGDIPPPGIQTVAREWSPLAYDKCELLQVNRDATFWMFTFTTSTWICADDGETEEQFDPLPDFLGANFNVDWIDPHDFGVPPSGETPPPEYDPRRGPPPWPVGPEGRIESEFKIDLPVTPRKDRH